MGFYYRSKAWLYGRFDRLIQVGDNWLYKAPSVAWPPGRAVTHTLGRWAGDWGWLLRDSFRLSAYRATGPNWSLVFVGSDKERLEAQHLFFPNQPVEWRDMGRVAQWSLPARSKRWLSEGADLVICELSRIFPPARGMALRFTVPTLIRQTIVMPDKVETLLAGGRMRITRNEIHRAQKDGFSYRFSRSAADYEHFYHNMYVPYIGARHGALATIAAHNGYMSQAFREGGLLLLTQNDCPMAGALLQIRGDTCYGVELGVLNGDNRLLIDHHINVLIYWYTMLWASSQGAKRVDLGASRPWCSDGVLRNKARWNPLVTHFEHAHGAWHLYAQQLSPAMQDYINQIGFITEIKGGFYRVVVEPRPMALDNAELGQLLGNTRRKGLKGLLVMTPGGSRTLQGEIEGEATPADA